MSNDLFANFAGNARSTVGDSSMDAPIYFVNGPISRAKNYGGLMDIEDDVERARKRLEMDTPENRQKTAEDRAAERERKKFAFHVTRALPRSIMEGWQLIREGREDEEVRVYTRTYDWKHRFWGIKPIGISMMEFWDRHDPDVLRHHDAQQECPLDPENPSGPLIGEPVKDLASTTEAVAKPRKQQKKTELNPTHKVRKSKAPSRKTNKKSTRKSLADETHAGPLRLEDQIPKEPSAASNIDGPSQNEKISPPPTPQHGPAPKDQDQLPTQSRRQQRHPTRTADPVPATSTPQTPKRPRGRPPKAHPATKNKDTSTPKRPRGRPPGKGKSTTTVQGNARVTKSSSSEKQKGRRALAPSTHVMRTRGKGAAESLQLP